jgi:hypothetical protein
MVGQVDLIGAVGVHRPDLAVAVLDPAEGNLGAVGRPGGSLSDTVLSVSCRMSVPLGNIEKISESPVGFPIVTRLLSKTMRPFAPG